MKQMTYEQYYDKVLGCWLGKTLGGCGGVAYEGVKKRIENVDFKEIINTELPNDDFDLQVMWLQSLEQYGPYLNVCQMASLWEETCRYPWSEYGYFMKNHKRGIKAPYCGWFNNSFYKDGMGCPIRSEIWATSFPGMADRAAEMATLDASLDHAADALAGEAFLARLESMLFVTDDVVAAITECVEVIDHSTKLYRCLAAILKNYKAGMSFDDNLEFIYITYSHNDFTNCTQNIGIAILGVLYGDLDMEKTINITLIGGYDADCTCATAGAIVGIAIGAKGISQELNKIEVFNIIIHPTLYELIKKSLSNTFIDQYSKIPTFLRMSTENYIEVEELILRIEHEFLRKRAGYKQILNNFVIALFIDLYRKSLHDQSTEEDSELKKEIITYINDHYINLKLADLAAHFGYSPAYFSKYFKRVMDITLSDYLQKKKINCALKLLVDTNLSIEEIMFELGYSDKKNFYQIFKKYTGSTPNQIRKSR